MLFDTSQDPFKLWIYAERYLSVGARSYSPFAEINEMDVTWQPSSNVPAFSIPCFWVERSQHAEFTCKSHRMIPDLADFYSPSSDRFLLPVHPAAIPLLPLIVQNKIKKLSPGPKLNVSPTASTRTVYVNGAYGSDRCPQHFLKLHFPGRISRFTRQMTKENVLHQLWVNEQIQKTRLPYLPDLGGGYIMAQENLSIGFLLRSIWPESYLQKPFFILPGFSLYSGDQYSPTDPPILVQLPQYFGETAVTFIVKRIIIPSINLWVKTVCILGLIPELHGQNILFCFKHEDKESLICFRDLDLFIDHRIRCQINNNQCDLQIGTLEYYANGNPEQILSLSYDGFLVHHFLGRVAILADDWFGIKVSVLRDAAISAFRAAGGDSLRLSNKTYYYDNQLHEGEQFVLTEHPKFDLWR